MSPAPHVSPRVRAYGKARIDITRRARDEDEWRRLWKGPSQPYAFTAGVGWKFNAIYTVEDYAAEIGFMIDVLGFPVLAFSPSHAQLSNPEGSFVLTILAAREDRSITPPDALRLQLNVVALLQVVKELERRGVTFDQQPVSVQVGSPWRSAAFRTPHGIVIELMSNEPLDNVDLGSGMDIERGSIIEPRDEVSINEPLALSGPHMAHAIPSEARDADLLLSSLSRDDKSTEKQSVDTHQSSDYAEAGDPASVMSANQLEASQASSVQPSLEPHAPAGVDRPNGSGGSTGKSGKPEDGSIELTYDALDDDDVAGEEINIDEDFP